MKFFLVLTYLVACAAGSSIPGRVLPKLKPLQRLPPIEGRITGGLPVPNISFRPFQVALLLDESYLCGGSIISNQWILTAAHCVASFSSVTVNMGSVDITNPLFSQTVTINSTNAYVHEYYNSITNDIAVIKLNTPLNITSTSTVQIINLPPYTTPADLYEGVTATASGWGLTDTIAGVPQFLRWVDLTVISNADCIDVFGPLADSTMCTQAPQPKSTCNGDSGGPLTYDNTIIGVVSFGAQVGCDKGYPTGFARVTSFLEWINQKTGIAIS